MLNQLLAPIMRPRKLSERAAVTLPEPDRVRYQVEKRSRSVDRDRGPMLFLAQQIVKRMEVMGYPSVIHCVYRSPEEQNALYQKTPRVTNARAFESAHQYSEAADIVHKTLFWNAPAEYWEALATCVRVVEQEYKVSLNHGHYWKFTDSAHVELTDWRVFAGSVGKNVPDAFQLAERFRQVLPSQAPSASKQ